MNKQLELFPAEEARLVVGGHHLRVDLGGSNWGRSGFDAHNSKPVICEPCRRGGGPKECVRPCVARGRVARHMPAQSP